MPSGAGSERTEKLSSAVEVEWKNMAEQNLPTLHSISTALFYRGIRFKGHFENQITDCWWRYDIAMKRNLSDATPERSSGRERSCRQEEIILKHRGRMLNFYKVRKSWTKCPLSLATTWGNFSRPSLWRSICENHAWIILKMICAEGKKQRKSF